MKEKILISACLMGFQVRYNQSDKPLRSALLERWQQEERLIVHCPELAAGLKTPRLPAELTGGQGADALAGMAKIREVDGSDVTPHYLLAAWLALKTAQENHCRFAIMTDGSPTCGSRRIYDGTFQGKTIAGEGVAAALLRQHGIEVFAEHQIAALAQRILEIERV